MRGNVSRENLALDIITSLLTLRRVWLLVTNNDVGDIMTVTEEGSKLHSKASEGSIWLLDKAVGDESGEKAANDAILPEPSSKLQKNTPTPGSTNVIKEEQETIKDKKSTFGAMQRRRVTRPTDSKSIMKL